MSETSGGPGWWMASDHRWYPPELHPDAPPAMQAPVQAPVQAAQGPELPPFGQPLPAIPRLPTFPSVTPTAPAAPPPAGTVQAAPVAPTTTPPTRDPRDTARMPSAPRRGISPGVLVIAALVVAAVVGGIFLVASLGSSAARQQHDTYFGSSGTGGAVGLADDTQAKSDLSTALTTVLAAASASQSGSVDAAALQAAEPSLQFVDAPAPSTSSSTVSVSDASGTVTLAAMSKSGICWMVQTAVGGQSSGVPGGEQYGAYRGGPCTATGSSSVGWQNAWTSPP